MASCRLSRIQLKGPPRQMVTRPGSLRQLLEGEIVSDGAWPHLSDWPLCWAAPRQAPLQQEPPAGAQMLTIPELKAVAAGLEVPLAGRDAAGREAILACFRRLTAPPGQPPPVRRAAAGRHATLLHSGAWNPPCSGA